MSFVTGVRSRARLARLVLRSGGAGRGPRRRDHPFVLGLRAGQVVPHQGGHWPNAQPNTTAAYRQAAPGTQILDVDVWLTEDGVLVCAHDDELEPGRRISTTPWAEIESTSSVPRFIDVATIFPEHRLNVEVKDARALDSVCDLIGSSDLADRTCLSTFSPVLARALAGAVPRAAHTRPTARWVGRIWGSGDVVQTMTFVPDAAPALGRLKPLLLRVLFSAGSPDLVRRQIPIAEKKGLPLFAWTVNDEVPLRELVKAGADAVLSDQPELFDAPFNIAIEVDSVTVAFFLEASGLTTEAEVIEHQAENDKARQITQKVAGHAATGEVTLKKSLGASTYLTDWFREVQEGKFESYRRNGSIVMFDPKGAELARWNFVNGWPKSWSASDLDAGGDDIEIEEVVISYEGLTRA